MLNLRRKNFITKRKEQKEKLKKAGSSSTSADELIQLADEKEVWKIRDQL